MRLLIVLLLCSFAYAETETWGHAPDSDYRGVEDTYLSLNSENYYREDELKVYTYPANTPANTILMEWDVNQIPPGAEIVTAKLQLYNINSGVDEFYDVSVHRIIAAKPKIPKATGLVTDGINKWAGDGYALGTKNVLPAEHTVEIDRYQGYKEWSITDMVQHWVDNPMENKGLLLASTKSSVGAFRSFASSEHSSANWRPKLVINYRAKEPTTLAELFLTISKWKNDEISLSEVLKRIIYWKI